MKAAQLQAYHAPLEMVDVPVPEPTKATDVLVRVGGAGVCATDLHASEGLMEAAGVSLPRVLGHENAGWVEAIGPGVSTVAVGDAVLVYPPYSCGCASPAAEVTTCTASVTSSLPGSTAAVIGDATGNLVGTWIDLWELLQLHTAGRVRLETETHPLDAVNEVLGRLRDGDVTGRAVLVP